MASKKSPRTFTFVHAMGWGCAMFNGCVARSCSDFGAQDNLGVGVLFALALVLVAFIAGLVAFVAAVSSFALASRSTTKRVMAAALLLAACVSGAGATRAVRSTMCNYHGEWCATPG